MKKEKIIITIIALILITLITTPIILKKVQMKNNKEAAYDLINAAQSYFSTSSEIEFAKMTGTTNLIDEIKFQGNKPDSGEVYINNKGETALAVVYDEMCYIKNFSDSELSEKKDIENCRIQKNYKCKRATTLHKEGSIIYGNQIITEGVLKSGDAFDCDVNGDGVYNEETERFYYVSDLYNTTTNEFDNNYGVLIYYNNTKQGLPDNTKSSITAYAPAEKENLYGPITAVTNLPTTQDWSNVKLSNTKRTIITEKNTTTVEGTELPKDFNYDGYSARLLTVQELNEACNIIVGSRITNELESCNYLLENTNHLNEEIGSTGIWLETPYSSLNDNAWQIYASSSYVRSHRVDYINSYSGTRPVIEILKADILY